MFPARHGAEVRAGPDDNQPPSPHVTSTHTLKQLSLAPATANPQSELVATIALHNHPPPPPPSPSVGEREAGGRRRKKTHDRKSSKQPLQQPVTEKENGERKKERKKKKIRVGWGRGGKGGGVEGEDSKTDLN